MRKFNFRTFVMILRFKVIEARNLGYKNAAHQMGQCLHIVSDFYHLESQCYS